MAGKKKIEQEDEDESVDRDVAEVKKGVAKAEREEESVDTSAGDDVDEVVLDEADEADEKPSRAARRAERGRNLVRESQEKAAELERRLADTERRHEALMAQLAADRAPKEKKPEVDPLEAIYEEQERLHANYQAAVKKPNGLTEQEAAHFRSEGRRIERAKLEAVAEAKYGKAQRGATVDEVAQQVAARELQAAHGDVIGRPDAFAWAKARMQVAIAEGKPDTHATVAEVMEEARAKYGLATKTTRPAPTNAQKARMGGIPRGGGGSGKQVYTLSDHDKKLANASYAHLPKEDRYKAYARDVLAGD
jgi:hypothetical protein